MKLFLSTSFSHQIDSQTGEVFPAFRQAVTALLTGLRQEDHQVFAAIEYENWKIAAATPEVAVKMDLAEIKAADAFLALVHDAPSAGVQFELGYAVAQQKRVILLRHTNHELSYYNQGAVSAGLVTLVTYEDMSGLLNQLTLALNAPT